MFKNSLILGLPFLELKNSVDSVQPSPCSCSHPPCHQTQAGPGGGITLIQSAYLVESLVNGANESFLARFGADSANTEEVSLLLYAI